MKSAVAALASGTIVIGGLAAFAAGPRALHAARPFAAPVVRHADIPTAFVYHPGFVVPVRRETNLDPRAATVVVRTFCATCHSDQRRMADLSLEQFDVGKADVSAEVAEKMINKLRAGMMPPPGRRRPEGDTLTALAATLERVVDQASSRPAPGSRTFQRLNRVEYERAIRDLLGIEIDAGSWLPLDTKSANFDNIADAQLPSATVLDGYFDAASEISRLAVGDPSMGATSKTYQIARLASQWDRVEGAPMGTRGGTSVIHTFPADGDYVFSFTLHAIPTGQLYGSTAPFAEKVEVSVNGERVALLDVDRSSSQSDPQGLEMKTPPIRVRAGPQRVTAAFLKTFDGPNNALIARIDHSIADTQIGSEMGITNLPHLRELVVTGPTTTTGVSNTPSRQRLFTCRPTAANQARPCAARIIADIGGAAYRRPLTQRDTDALLEFYDRGAANGGFEPGIRAALEAILSSPHFVFRIEEVPSNAKPGERYAVSDADLASRLSFFVWGLPPDAELIDLARRRELSKPKTLEAQARRLIADPRSEALATRFAAQWLRLQDIEKVHPDALQFPDFHEQLAHSMRRETELFFHGLVRENRSVLELFNANYTYVDGVLAKHYGIGGVTGAEFQRVEYPDNRRSGLFGHASMLTLTSHANRTSPVLRGKWVMEVLMGTPPPPPPPDVPDLDKTEDARDGRFLTTRERMEMHRENPSCNSCHQFIDPIGLALDNFDVTGRWRIREFGEPVDTRGELYDGTPISSPAELKDALLRRPIPLVRTFTQNLMAYALGRRVEYFDQPAVRIIERETAKNGYRVPDIVVGVVMSDAFRFRQLPAVSASDSH